MKGSRVADLEWCVARHSTWQTSESLSIMSPGDTGEGGYTPPESATIHGKENILKLRDFLNDLFPADTEATK